MHLAVRNDLTMPMSEQTVSRIQTFVQLIWILVQTDTKLLDVRMVNIPHPQNPILNPRCS